MEVKDIVSTLEALSNEKSLNYEQKQTVEELYAAVLKKEFKRTGCPDCYRDAVIEALAYLKKHGDVKKETRYVLKNGEYFYLGGFGSSDFYTRSTMTDEKAVEYLAETNGEGADKFSKLPDNWKEEVYALKNAEAKEAPASEEEAPKDEAPAVEAEPAPKSKTQKSKK